MTPSPLLRVLLDHVARQPDAPALLWRHEAISYGALGRMAWAAAGRLRALGLPHDRPVGIVARKSPRAVALILGCLMVRQRFVLPSAELGAATLRVLFDSADCSHVLAPDAPSAARVADLEAIPMFDDAPLPEPPLEGCDCPASDETTFMLTTSGSTGLPKIVPLPAGAVDAFTDWACARFAIRPGKTVLNYAPLNFDLCFLDVWATLKGGACVLLVEEDRAANPAGLLELLDATPVHVLQAVPMMYRLLTDATLGTDRAFAAAEHVIFTGDSMPAASLGALPRLFPNARLCNIYGCTETNDSFLFEVDPAAGPPRVPLPIGAPLPGVRALIIDDGGAIVEGPGSGELLVSTPFQTTGYLEPTVNEGKFVRRRDGDGEKVYFRSGDLVCRHDDGSITLHGRKDFHVKVRGVRVNTQEVERVILDHGDVQEAAVVAVPDAMAGHRLRAIVRRKDGQRLNSLGLRQHCAALLPRIAIPSDIEFVETPLPKTSTGKVDRRQLLQSHLKGDHDALSHVH